MRSGVEITRSPGGEVVIASVGGDVDMLQVPRIQAALAGALVEGGVALVIDLSRVRYFDSTGVRLLFSCSENFSAAVINSASSCPRTDSCVMSSRL